MLLQQPPNNDKGATSQEVVLGYVVARCRDMPAHLRGDWVRLTSKMHRNQKIPEHYDL